MSASALPEPSPDSVRSVRYDKILLFGDSITELSSDILSLDFALTPALQQTYFRKLSVVARGYGGYTSEDLRHVLPPTLRAETGAGESIRLLVIEVGTNDASGLEIPQVPVERFAENLIFMVETTRAAGIERIVIVGLGPIDDQRLPAQPADKRSVRNMRYSKAAKTISEQVGVPFVDLWHSFLLSIGWEAGRPVPGQDGGSQGLETLLTDGVHFSGKGYRIWYEQLLRTIRETYPELRRENLPDMLPHVSDLDRSGLPDTLWNDASQ
ncbi:mitochondrial peroxiredoxin PRX1 [Purpureocillium lavendulum]|uniref:Mitochondrial peroxiredoxin PRX1 n=1 Tax=Purpureocillium lavendulum TaxID=1247861 RepID=A0AB34FE19_9HYPO|nr:mitochondrial peroxiredoxin PRX1 [Purpureocillium lavendulum]